MTLCEKVTCIICRIKWLLKICIILIMVFFEQQNQSDAHTRRIHAAAEPDSIWLQQSRLCKNTADDKDLVSDSSSSPEFIQELLPSAERTTLLYHLSYLCLGGFPEMERVIRERANKTQLLFGSSEALLLKCSGTSDNFVTVLLPNLTESVEKNKPELAQKQLEEAKELISDIIMDVKEIVKRYNEHNSDVAATTSDIITETLDTEKQQQQLTREMEELQKIIDGLEEKRLNIRKKIEDNEKKTEEKNADIQNIISRRCFINDLLFNEEHPEDQIKALRADLSETTEAQKILIEEEWDIQNQLMENQQKMDKLENKKGQLSSIRSLDEVQESLSQTQTNLVQLQKFWEKVGSKLDTLKERIFAGEIWIDDLTDMKEEFLKSIAAAEEGWTKFGINYMKANNIFSIQTNEAYRFLEINPSSLSEEEWIKEYESVKEKLHS